VRNRIERPCHAAFEGSSRACSCIVVGDRRCCGEGWPWSCLGGLAFHTRPWAPMAALLCIEHTRNVVECCWSALMPLLRKTRWHGCQRRAWCKSSLINRRKQAPLPAPPYQHPPSLTRATAAMHQYPQQATPQQPRIRTISNRRRSLQALVLDTSACQIFNTWPTQLGTQLWPNLMFPGKPGDATYL
jgi:hypothetical protein